VSEPEGERLLRSWFETAAEQLPSDVCAVVQLLHASPQRAADLLSGSSEDGLVRFAGHVRRVVGTHDQPTQLRLCAGLGQAVGVLLQRALTARDVGACFRASLTAYYFKEALIETGQAGWEVFQASLREPLRAPPLPDYEGYRKENPWKHSRILFDLLMKSSSRYAPEIEDRPWYDILDAFGLGVHAEIT
jgi:hypothetical protein